jgi:hypothetical protein
MLSSLCPPFYSCTRNRTWYKHVSLYVFFRVHTFKNSHLYNWLWCMFIEDKNIWIFKSPVMLHFGAGKLFATFRQIVVPSSSGSSSIKEHVTLRTKAPCPFETSVTPYQSKHNNIPEDLNLQQHWCENRRSRIHAYTVSKPLVVQLSHLKQSGFVFYKLVLFLNTDTREILYMCVDCITFTHSSLRGGCVWLWVSSLALKKLLQLNVILWLYIQNCWPIMFVAHFGLMKAWFCITPDIKVCTVLRTIQHININTWPM